MREIEYLKCLNQIKRVIPKNFDILICENTINKENEISNNELKSLLKDNNSFLMGSIDNNTENIGFGELMMLHSSLIKVPVNDYNFISYITARRIFTCPYVFEMTNNCVKDALISNPDFLYLNGQYVKVEKQGLYNDMFFSMRTKHMIEYANFAYKIIKNKNSIYNLIKRKTGSEHILFEYVKKNKLSCQYLDWLGIIRNDWRKGDNFLDFNNFHLC